MSEPTERNHWLAARAQVRNWLHQHLPECRYAPGLLPVLDGEPSAPDAVGDWPDLDTLLSEYPALLAPGLRKRRGAWFTPVGLAKATAQRTLAPLLANGPRPLRVVDPAVGGGAFLLAAFDVLIANGWAPHDAAACLHGVDLDDTIAAATAVALWQRSGGEPDLLGSLHANVRRGDGLRDLDDGTFDAVLANPPWETLQGDGHDAAERDALRRRFLHQGRGKRYTYRLFLERSCALLRDGGRFGLLVPASLWFDRDARQLREMLLDTCDWQWLYGFENRRREFAIDPRYRYAVIVGSRGGRTDAVRVAFGRVDHADWAAPEPGHVRYPREHFDRLSPGSHAFVEVDEPRDLAILEQVVARSVPLLGSGGCHWRQGDHNMTSHRHRFVPLAEAEAAGFARGDDGLWRDGDRVLAPLYQGAMLDDLHPNTGTYAGGEGRATRWVPPASPAELRPQYLVAPLAKSPWPARIALRALSNASNERTAIACLLPPVPCGNSLVVLTPMTEAEHPLRQLASCAAVLSSLPFDWQLRLRLTGTNLNRFVLADCGLPKLSDADRNELARLALRLCAILPWHMALWRRARSEGWGPRVHAPAVESGERERLHTRIDALVGAAYGMTAADVAWIVRGCDRPTSSLRRGRTGDLPARGFWRLDKQRPPAQRRPRRWLAAAERAGRSGAD